MQTKRLTLSIFLIVAMSLCQAQIYTLNDVIDQVQQSYAVANASTNKRVADLKYQLFQAELKPQIGLNARIPNYTKTSRAIVQPNGSIAFQSISQSNASASLLASQVIPSTGGEVFVQTDLQRFDDFSSDSKLYNGVPIRVGIQQPIFGYNKYKFGREIEFLRREEAAKTYDVAIEQATLEAVSLYFNVLMARENQLIAQTNETVNERLLNITNERFNLGKVSKDQKLQLEIELKNANLNRQQADYEYRRSLGLLQTYLGQPVDTAIDLQTPDVFETVAVNWYQLYTEAMTNSPTIIAQQRAMLEADDFAARQRADYGIKTNLFASYGVAKSAGELAGVYKNPFEENQIALTLAVPIVDWGRRKSAMKIASLRREDAEDRIQQETLEFQNRIRETGQQFLQLQNEIDLQRSILENAEQRAEISNQRYVLGDISITDLTIAQREKDAVQRNFIRVLRNYWIAYYQVRVLTGYDIRTNKTIQYN